MNPKRLVSEQLRSSALKAGISTVRFVVVCVGAVAATSLLYQAFEMRTKLRWLLGVKFIALMAVFWFIVSSLYRFFELRAARR